MPRLGNKVRIPFTEKQALDLLLKVKPTLEMPKLEAHPTKPKKSAERRREQFK